MPFTPDLSQIICPRHCTEAIIYRKQLTTSKHANKHRTSSGLRIRRQAWLTDSCLWKLKGSGCKMLRSLLRHEAHTRKKEIHLKWGKGDSTDSWWPFSMWVCVEAWVDKLVYRVCLCHCRRTLGISFVDPPPNHFPTEKKGGRQALSHTTYRPFLWGGSWNSDW